MGQDSLAAPSRCSSPTRLPVNQTSAASDDVLLFLVQPVTLGEAGGSPQGPNIAQVRVILMVRCGQLLLKDVSEVARLPLQAAGAGCAVHLHGMKVGRHTVHRVAVHWVPHGMVHPSAHTLKVWV